MGFAIEFTMQSVLHHYIPQWEWDQYTNQKHFTQTS